MALINFCSCELKADSCSSVQNPPGLNPEIFNKIIGSPFFASSCLTVVLEYCYIPTLNLPRYFAILSRFLSLSFLLGVRWEIKNGALKDITIFELDNN
jgi:hypothetical protein